MAAINKIEVFLQTASVRDAETDGRVYAGIGGREFVCSIDDHEDFPRGGSDVYVFGAGANVEWVAANDPRNPQIREEDLDRFPVYIRFDQGSESHWALQRATVSVNGSIAPRYESRLRAPLWLGLGAGAYCYLFRHLDTGPGGRGSGPTGQLDAGASDLSAET